MNGSPEGGGMQTVRLQWPSRSVRRILFLLTWPCPVFAQGLGSLHGIVQDSLGGVVSEAHVRIRGLDAQGITDSDGAFQVQGVRPGEFLLDVRRLGYRPASFEVTVAADSDSEVILALAPAPEQLSPV
jgi:hypothetical protein